MSDANWKSDWKQPHFTQVENDRLVAENDILTNKLCTAESEVERLRQKAICFWTCDDDGIYQTSCGEAWQFTHDGLQENAVTFCPYCGCEIRERSAGDDKL